MESGHNPGILKRKLETEDDRHVEIGLDEEQYQDLPDNMYQQQHLEASPTRKAVSTPQTFLCCL